MKRTGIDHPKTMDLAMRLNRPQYQAVGILECLWHWTAKYAPHGNVGRWSNAAIAGGIKWDGDPDELVEALVGSKLLDRHPDESIRLLVHDWPDHCDDGVHAQLAKAVELFADGSMPRIGRAFNTSTAARIRKQYRAKFPNLRPDEEFHIGDESHESRQEVGDESRLVGEKSTPSQSCRVESVASRSHSQSSRVVTAGAARRDRPTEPDPPRPDDGDLTRSASRGGSTDPTDPEKPPPRVRSPVVESECVKLITEADVAKQNRSAALRMVLRLDKPVEFLKRVRQQAREQGMTEIGGYVFKAIKSELADTSKVHTS